MSKKISSQTADDRYNEKRYVKRVSFNTETETCLIAKIEKIENFSEWVKDKLRQEASP